MMHEQLSGLTRRGRQLLSALVALPAAVLSIACSTSGDARQTVEPGDSSAASVTPAPAISREQLAGITLSVVAEPAVVSPGDTVRLITVARNATQQRVQIGIACGPSMDVLVTTPTGGKRSALSDIVKNGVFICPLLPEHFVDAGSTRQQTLAWVAPNVRGTYRAAGALRRSDGLGNLSAQVTFEVR